MLAEKLGAGIQLTEQPYQWVRFDNEGGESAFLSVNSGLALDVADGNFSADAMIELWKATGHRPQCWRIIEDEDHCYIAGADNMALTYNGDKVELAEYVKSENQRWLITEDDD